MRVSAPEPPMSLSSPSPPLTTSVPPKDAITSEPDVPVMVSSPSVPTETLAFGKLVLVSLPKTSAIVSAASETKVVILDDNAVVRVVRDSPPG